MSLSAGTYLLGISRGYPAEGPPAPPGEYRVTIEREQSLPASGDVEPNDDPATATPIGNPVSLIGTVDGPIDIYRWTITPAEAATRWQLDLRGISGDILGIRLTDGEGDLLVDANLLDGQAHLYDLQLAAGDYLLELSSNGDHPVPYVLTSQAVVGCRRGPGAQQRPVAGHGYRHR